MTVQLHKIPACTKGARLLPLGTIFYGTSSVLNFVRPVPIPNGKPADKIKRDIDGVKVINPFKG